MLHTNPPCHTSFGAYTKAVFLLETPGGARIGADAHWQARRPRTLATQLLLQIKFGSRRSCVESCGFVQEVQAALGPNERPAVNTGGGPTGDAGHGGAAHPAFGPTFVYAYNGAVFEVLRNGRLASLTLFVPFQHRADAQQQ